VAEEPLAAFVGAGQRRDLVQHALQVLAALALGDLASPLEAAGELVGDKAEQFGVRCGVGTLVGVTLDREQPDRALVHQQRDADPELRRRADVARVDVAFLA
jgi:hypothetical protein